MSRGSSNPPNPDDVKLLPDVREATAASLAPASLDPAKALALPAVVSPASTPAVELPITPTAAPARQLAERPKEDLDATAAELGLDPRRFKTRQDLIAAIHARRQLIASLNRDALVDVLRWARRPPSPTASKEALAHEIAGLRTMRFSGLSQRGLVVLATMRGIEASGDEPVPVLIKRLKRQEGVFAKLNRKRRAMLGAIVSNMMGEEDEPAMEAPRREPGGDVDARRNSSASIKEEIEEAGLFGGLAGRIKKSTDSYLNQKLDEIESRIDRKLDEIDRRLGEWRDKEVANRIRILKITLWASVTVGAFSLIYSYIKVYIWH